MTHTKRCEGVGSKKSCCKHKETSSCRRKRKRTGCKRKRTRRKRRCLVPAGRKFFEVVFRNVKTTNDFIALPNQKMSNRSLISYAVVNRGGNGALVRLEIGPNGRDYIIDSESEVGRGAMDIMVPSKFMRFVRVSVKSLEPGLPTKLTIYYQAQ